MKEDIKAKNNKIKCPRFKKKHNWQECKKCVPFYSGFQDLQIPGLGKGGIWIQCRYKAEMKKTKP